MKTTIKAELLKSPADFTELLNLQSLKTQLEVADMINKNLRTYQENFVKSFIKTGDQILAILASKDHDSYFKSITSMGDFEAENVFTLEQSLINREDSAQNLLGKYYNCKDHERQPLSRSALRIIGIVGSQQILREFENAMPFVRSRYDVMAEKFEHIKNDPAFKYENNWIIDYKNEDLIEVPQNIFEPDCGVTTWAFDLQKDMLTLTRSMKQCDWSGKPVGTYNQYFIFDLSKNEFVKSYDNQ